MSHLLFSIMKAIIGFLCILSPVIAVLIALALRDRRQGRLSTTALQLLNRPEFRGLFSVSIRTHLFSEETVSVEIWSCSRDQVRDVLEGLAERLPRGVRFEVNGWTDARGLRSPRPAADCAGGFCCRPA